MWTKTHSNVISGPDIFYMEFLIYRQKIETEPYNNMGPNITQKCPTLTTMNSIMRKGVACEHDRKKTGCNCGCSKATTKWTLKEIKTFLTNWDRMTHIYVSGLNIIGSDNGLDPTSRQAIIWDIVSSNLSIKFQRNQRFHSRKCIWTYRMRNGGNFASTSKC